MVCKSQCLYVNIMGTQSYLLVYKLSMVASALQRPCSLQSQKIYYLALYKKGFLVPAMFMLVLAGGSPCLPDKQVSLTLGVGRSSTPRPITCEHICELQSYLSHQRTSASEEHKGISLKEMCQPYRRAAQPQQCPAAIPQLAFALSHSTCLRSKQKKEEADGPLCQFGPSPAEGP